MSLPVLKTPVRGMVLHAQKDARYILETNAGFLQREDVGVGNQVKFALSFP